MSYELQKHQSRVSDAVGSGGSKLALHSMGSGKTLTAADTIVVAQARNPATRTLVITPASLVANFFKELDKHDVPVDRTKIEVLSYEKAANDIDRLLQQKHDLVIMDEAHRMRNADTKRFQTLEKALMAAESRLLMTGTGAYNKVSDLGTLVNLSSGEKVFPRNPRDFDNRYIERVKHEPGFLMKLMGAKPGETTRLKNKRELAEKLKGRVDYHDASEGQAHMFPSVHEEVTEVEMSPEQVKYYRTVTGDMPWILRKKIEMGMPLSKQESSDLNSFATGARQVSNSIAPYVKGDALDAGMKASKLVQAVIDLQARRAEDPNFKGIIYSNYLQAGIDPMQALLEEQGIEPGVFTGSLSKKEKNELVRKYNSGESPVLLLSSSGGEGLDLKGTKMVQILEPHFNKSKIKQVVARSARYGSHLHLPDEERNVLVKHYAATRPKSTWNKLFGSKPGMTIDQYLMEHSDQKEALNERVIELLKAQRNAG